MPWTFLLIFFVSFLKIQLFLPRKVYNVYLSKKAPKKSYGFTTPVVQYKLKSNHFRWIILHFMQETTVLNHQACRLGLWLLSSQRWSLEMWSFIVRDDIHRHFWDSEASTLHILKQQRDISFLLPPCPSYQGFRLTSQQLPSLGRASGDDCSFTFPVVKPSVIYL